ncbi:MAG: matrixin family metalloprotease [Candidatus Aenigmarchaeota archaeon]|nr:matrixin family metalloprotease [Candidatus Aenigmarchaeota archaeon]
MYSMYRNPDLVKNIFNHPNKSNIGTTTTTQQYQTTTTDQYRTLSIPYLLDYSFKTIYFYEQFSGEIDEYNLGPPLDGLLKTGWKISYSDLELELYGTSDQKVTVRVKDTFIQTTTTTTIPNVNLVTPELLSDRTTYITNDFRVYINDSFLKVIDPNAMKGLYNNSMYSLKKAFAIWEEETKLVHFTFVSYGENYNLYVKWSGDMPTTEGGSQYIAYAAPSTYNCGNYKFIDGGSLVLSVKNSSKEIQTDLHEIGHILNLADLGNSNMLMSTWYDDSQTLSEGSLRKLITPAINDTLKVIINPDLNCNFSNH